MHILLAKEFVKEPLLWLLRLLLVLWCVLLLLARIARRRRTKLLLLVRHASVLLLLLRVLWLWVASVSRLRWRVCNSMGWLLTWVATSWVATCRLLIATISSCCCWLLCGWCSSLILLVIPAVVKWCDITVCVRRGAKSHA